jgi:hypothetical protein
MTGLLLVACNLLGLGIGALMTGVLSDVFSANEIFEPLTKALLSADIVAAAAPLSFIIASIYLEKMKPEPELPPHLAWALILLA